MKGWRVGLRRFGRHRGGMAGGVIAALFVATALLAPWLAPHDPEAMQLGASLASPSRAHPFGTDSLGRDVLSQTIYGARVSLTIGFVSVGLALLGGVPLGALSGYAGGWLDRVAMRGVDVLVSFPTILLAIIVITIFGPGRILWRHVLPNCLAPVLVQSTLFFATAILSAAYLGFLGLGAQPPTPEWGTMLSKARDFLRVAPHVSVFPGLTIMLTVLGLNLLGDGLRDVLDPRAGPA